MGDINRITGQVISCAYNLHTRLGPGLLETVYEAVLAELLIQRGLSVERQVKVPIHFEGLRFDEGFRADLIVDGCVLVELKSVERSAPVFIKQTLTYLRLLELPIGLLINFGAARLSEGLKRVVNDRAPDAHLVIVSPRRPGKQLSHTGEQGEQGN